MIKKLLKKYFGSASAGMEFCFEQLNVVDDGISYEAMLVVDGEIVESWRWRYKPDAQRLAHQFGCMKKRWQEKVWSERRAYFFVSDKETSGNG
jgi:hypothetical protein